MSSNIKIQRICDNCGQEFTARTTKTKYCSKKCNSQYYKAQLRQEKIESSNKETIKTIMFPLDQLKAKEFLTVKEVATLLSCSIRTIYYYIDQGEIKAVNLGKRMTRVKRSELDKIFH